MMRKLVAYAGALALASILGGPAAVAQDVIVDQDAAEVFVTLDRKIIRPEGITVNPSNGDIIVSTAVTRDDELRLPGGELLRFDSSGQLRARILVGGAPLLGLAYNPVDDKVYMAYVGRFGVDNEPSYIRRVEVDFDDNSQAEDVAIVPGIGAPPNRIVPNPDTSQDEIQFGNVAQVPNGLAFTAGGDLYFSDSFQGAVFRIVNPAINCGNGACVAPVGVETVVHSSLLATTGFPPFGANGVAFNQDESILYVANTGDDRVLALDLETGEISVLAEAINGADGLEVDDNGNIWVSANQADNIVVLNPVGRVIARLGSFQGIRNDGSPRGLLFPASHVLFGNNVYVANLAGIIRNLGPNGPEPEADVTRYTISVIEIPNALRTGDARQQRRRR